MKPLFTNGTLQPFTPVFYIPFPARWTLAIAFIGLLVTTNNITSSFVPLNVKGFLVYHRLEKFYTAISSVIDCWTNLWIESVSGMDCAWWMLSGSTILSDLGKYTAIIDGTNFMAASENSLGVWTTIWPDFTFRKMTFFLRHLLGLCHGVPHCRTSTMTFSRTFSPLIVEK